MAVGYLLTTSAVDLGDARALVRFSAGPWAQMVALPPEASLVDFPSFVRRARDAGDGAPIDPLLLVALPPIIPRIPKIAVPPDDSIVLIALCRLQHGLGRMFSRSLAALTADEERPVVDGALRMTSPYNHVLLDITDVDEASALRRLDEAVDHRAVLDVQVGLAIAKDVTYPTGVPASG